MYVDNYLSGDDIAGTGPRVNLSNCAYNCSGMVNCGGHSSCTAAACNSLLRVRADVLNGDDTLSGCYHRIFPHGHRNGSGVALISPHFHLKRNQEQQIRFHSASFNTPNLLSCETHKHPHKHLISRTRLTVRRVWPAMASTTPKGNPCASRTGPCSMCNCTTYTTV